MTVAEEQTPFEHACTLLKDMIVLQQAGDPSWRERVPTFYSLIAQITDPADGWRLDSLVAQWLRHVTGQKVALQADLLLLQAQLPEPGA